MLVTSNARQGCQHYHNSQLGELDVGSCACFEYKYSLGLAPEPHFLLHHRFGVLPITFSLRFYDSVWYIVAVLVL